MTDLRLLYVTVSSVAEAVAIGRAVVEARLAACADVLLGMTSIYWWYSNLEQAEETVLILKTRADLVERATEAVKARHSYTCPCVIVLPIEDGNPDYLDWLRRETTGA